MVDNEPIGEIEEVKEDDNKMTDKYAMRPTISAVATLFIAAGASKASSNVIEAGILVLIGLGLYAFKAYMYSKGYFIEGQ